MFPFLGQKHDKVHDFSGSLFNNSSPRITLSNTLLAFSVLTINQNVIFDLSLLVKDGGWRKQTTAKECCQLLEAENGPPVIAYKKAGTSVLQM